MRDFVERVWNQSVPQQRIHRAPVGVKLRRAQLLPKRKGRKIHIAVLIEVVSLVVRIANLEEPALELMLDMQAVLPRVSAPGILVEPIHSLAKVGQRAER